MKTYVLVYEGFAHFEVVLASYFLKTKGDIITVGIDEKMVTSAEGFQIIPHMTLKDLTVSNIDAFIIPGGEPEVLEDCTDLYKLITELDQNNRVIGAICGGPVHLARANILKGRHYTTSLELGDYKEFEASGYKNQNVVIDGNIITAKACGYVDFAIELGNMMQIYKDEADLVETIEFFKHFRS